MAICINTTTVPLSKERHKGHKKNQIKNERREDYSPSEALAEKGMSKMPGCYLNEEFGGDRRVPFGVVSRSGICTSIGVDMCIEEGTEKLMDSGNFSFFAHFSKTSLETRRGGFAVFFCL